MLKDLYVVIWYTNSQWSHTYKLHIFQLLISVATQYQGPACSSRHSADSIDVVCSGITSYHQCYAYWSIGDSVNIYMRLQSKVNWHHGKIERQDEGQTEAPGAQPNIQPRTLGAQATGQLEAVGTSSNESTRGSEALAIPTRANDWETGWVEALETHLISHTLARDSENTSDRPNRGSKNGRMSTRDCVVLLSESPEHCQIGAFK